MRRMKKTICCIFILLLVFSVSGCAGLTFSQKDIPDITEDDEDDKNADHDEEMTEADLELYEEIFPDSDAAGKKSMRTFKMETEDVGSFYIFVDTSKGYRFKFNEDSGQFSLLNQDNKLILRGDFASEEGYKTYTSYFVVNENYPYFGTKGELEYRTVNKREFAVAYLEDEKIYNGFTYLADCGLDYGLLLEVEDVENLKYIAFGGKPLPDSRSDVDFYLGDWEIEPDYADEEYVKFPNGKYFKLKEYKVAPDESSDTDTEKHYTIKSGNADGDILIAASYDKKETTVDELAEKIAEEFGSEDGDIETIKNEDGAYVFVNRDGEDSGSAAFIMETEDGVIYSLVLHAFDWTGALDKLKFVASSFFAGGIAGKDMENYRCIGEISFTVPKEAVWDYSSEYNQKYKLEEEDMAIVFHSISDSEFRSFLCGTTDKYYDLYEMEEIGTYESKDFGTLTIVEASDKENGHYEYFVGNKDGKLDIAVSSTYATKPLTLDQCKDILKKFIP